MKNTKTLLFGFSLAATVFTGLQSAQANNPSTNIIQNISVALTFRTQGPTKINFPVRNENTETVLSSAVTTKTVINWLGAATTNKFPAAARLVRVLADNSAGRTIAYQVRSGTNILADVTPFFAQTTSSDKMDFSTLNLLTGARSGGVYENLHVQFTNAAPFNLVPNFSVGGSAIVTYNSIKIGSVYHISEAISAPTLAGSGMGTNGLPALITGSLTVISTGTEIK